MHGKRTQITTAPIVDGTPTDDARTAAASSRALETVPQPFVRPLHPRTGKPLGEWQYLDKQGHVRTMSLRTRKFITAYAQHGNGARAVREAGYNSPRSELQSAIATEYLKKPVVNNRVQELLAGMNITQERILEIHTRNMLQTDNLNVSQKAVETFEHMLGMHAPREGTGGTVNVSINIE